VRDKVKEAGGDVIGLEGEDTGEWVLVDLGDMIVHIMQPAIRQYYRLEEIWGDKPVKLGAAKRKSTVEAAEAAAARRPSPSTWPRTRKQPEVKPVNERKPAAKKAAAAEAAAARSRRQEGRRQVPAGKPVVKVADQDRRRRRQSTRKPPSRRTARGQGQAPAADAQPGQEGHQAHQEG
jgi:ribosome-associated protein